MNKKTTEQTNFWKKFCESDSSYNHLKDHPFDAWSFGDTPEMGDELGALVLEGKKIATTSLYHSYKGHEGELPKIGTYEMILDGSEIPLGIIFTHKLYICKYSEVDEIHAREEGEGDLSLDYWRREHLRFFSKYKKDFNESDLVVCEKFTLVYS